MKYVVVLFILFSNTTFAGGLFSNSMKKTLEEYTYSKCVNNVHTVTMLKAKLTTDEVCRYGKYGCSSIQATDKILAYCSLNTLSQCFEKKAWKTIDQILNFPITKVPGAVSYGLNKEGIHKGQTCMFWD